MYNYLLKHPELFQYVIGINFSQFQAILPKFSSSLRQAEYQRAWRRKRLRNVGGGRKAKLIDDNQKLFFILLYYKIYPTFRFAQVLIGLDKRNIQLWVEFLAPILFSSLGYELSLKKRLHRINSFEAFIEEYPELSEFIVDCTERLPLNSAAMADLGYQGTQDINPHLKIIMPQKKPPLKELTAEQKQVNKAISSIRIMVEHPFSYLKHFGILAQKYRGRIQNRQNLDLPFKTIACIYNFTRPPS